MTTPIAGRLTPGRRRSTTIPTASMAPVVPAETTASAFPSATSLCETTKRAARFRSHSLAGLLVHVDHLIGYDVRQGPWIDSQAPDQDRSISSQAAKQRAGDDRLGGVVAAHGGQRLYGSAWTFPTFRLNHLRRKITMRARRRTVRARRPAAARPRGHGNAYRSGTCGEGAWA